MDSITTVLPEKVKISSVSHLTVSLVIVCIMLASCSSVRKSPGSKIPFSSKPYAPQSYGIKDKRPELWNLNNARVDSYVERYSKTKTVETCLQRSKQNVT